MSGKRILLVDDEEMVAQSILLMLQMDQHTVDLAANGPAALSLFQKGEYDLVITDYRMPGMHGLEMAAEMRRLRPEQKILLLTGVNPDVPRGSVDLVMHKPFSRKELRAAVAALTSSNLPDSAP